MRSMLSVVFCLSLSSLSYGQSLNVISSSQSARTSGVMGGTPYGEMDTDSILATANTNAYYDGSPGVPGDTIEIDPTVFAELYSYPSGAFHVMAYSTLGLSYIGPNLSSVMIGYEQAAVAQAEVEAVAANPLDDVEVKITFTNGCGEDDPYLAYVHYVSNGGGGEFFRGMADSNLYWFMTPEWSSMIEYGVDPPWETPENGLDQSFNLIVDSGSRVRIDAGAGVSYTYQYITSTAGPPVGTIPVRVSSFAVTMIEVVP